MYHVDMNVFERFAKSGLSQSLSVIGEPASIGADQFKAAFDDSQMDVSRTMFGDDDEVTTSATLLKSQIKNKPVIGEILKRVNKRATYVITEVQEDLESYELTLREKNA
jgi:4-hydroxy-L-threonine phosphate dehydrogenase PdxA